MEKRQAKAGSFEERWLHRQHACGEDDLGPPTFLKCGEAVLPDEAAPLLGFEEAAKPRRLWDVFGPKDMWSAPDKQRVASYQMIGSDGSGNPICIEDGAGAVWITKTISAPVNL